MRFKQQLTIAVEALLEVKNGGPVNPRDIANNHVGEEIIKTADFLLDLKYLKWISHKKLMHILKDFEKHQAEADSIREALSRIKNRLENYSLFVETAENHSFIIRKLTFGTAYYPLKKDYEVWSNFNQALLENERNLEDYLDNKNVMLLKKTFHGYQDLSCNITTKMKEKQIQGHNEKRMIILEELEHNLAKLETIFLYESLALSPDELEQLIC